MNRGTLLISRMDLRTRALLMATALCCPLWALAHDSWLAGGQRTVPVGKSLAFDMTSGEHFPVAGSAIARDRIEVSACRQGSKTFALQPTGRSPKALRLTADAPAPDAVTCWVQLKPRVLDLAISKVEEYLDEIDAPPSVREAWARSPSPKRWKETYTKNAKVLVPMAGTSARSSSADTPVGLKLELVADVDLTGGRVSGTLPVTVLLDGKPLAGLAVAMTGEHKAPVQRQRTDAQGKVVFAAPKAGRWMLSATDLRPVDIAQGTWESQFTTFVFEVVEGP